MKSKAVFSTGLVLALLAWSGIGQAATAGAAATPAAQGKIVTAEAPRGGSAASSASAPKAGMQGRDAAKVDPRQAPASGMARSASGARQQTAYRAALRKCVSGPAERRERCLDEAIARFHRK